MVVLSSGRTIRIVAKKWLDRRGTRINTGINLNLLAFEHITGEDDISTQTRLSIFVVIHRTIIHNIVTFGRRIARRHLQGTIGITVETVEQLYKVGCRANATIQRSLEGKRQIVRIVSVSARGISVLLHIDVLRIITEIGEHIYHILILRFRIVSSPFLLVK